MRVRLFLTGLLILTITGCEDGDTDLRLNAVIDAQGLRTQLPDNALAPEAAGPVFELGKALFFTKSLSMNGDTACVSCHHPMLGGGDALSLPVGVDALVPELLGPGRTHDGDRSKDRFADGAPNVPRNSPTIFNLQFYNRSIFWDGRIKVLEEEHVSHGEGQKLQTPDSIFDAPDPLAGNNLSAAQARFPVTSNNEMFGHGPGHLEINEEKRSLLLQRLRNSVSGTDSSESKWVQAFKEAFQDESGDPAQVITMERITEALSVYQRSQVFIDNPWYSYLQGESDALTSEEKKGALLFYSDQKEGGYACNQCHRGGTLTDELYHNLAIPQFGRGKHIQGFDTGRLQVTNLSTDKYKFRTPSLLNTEVTGPWGHTGAYIRLEDIVRHHLNIEKAVSEYDYSLKELQQFRYLPPAEDKYRALTERALDTLKDSPEWVFAHKSEPNEDHVEQLTAFLKTLTDPCVNDSECLSRWIPDAQSVPDPERLVASFSDFSEQSNTYTSPQEEQSEAVVISDDLLFTDVSAVAGFNYSMLPGDNLSEVYFVAGGLAVGDYNKDGFEDVFVSHSLQPGKLFLNSGNGSFNDVTKEVLGDFKTRQFGGIFFDPDADGDLDLLVSTDDESSYSNLWVNNGNGSFIESDNNAGLKFSRATQSFSLADIDGDRDLDLFAGHWGIRKDSENPGYLWRNDGKGIFHDASDIVPETPPAIVSKVADAKLDVRFTGNFADIDADGDVDLLISGDFGTSQILKNDAGRTFTDETDQEISDENGMGGAVGDYDNDGDLDWFVTSIHNPSSAKTYIGGDSGNRLYQNNGTGDMKDVTGIAGVREGFWGWGACFADFNNDGWLDIFHTNGMTDPAPESSPYQQFLKDPSRLFMNNKDGTFSERSAELGVFHSKQGRGISCFDYDNDGDIDIMIANNGEAPSLYRNNSEENGYVSVTLQGDGKNPMAVGAKVWLTADGITQFRQLQLGSNYLSNNSLVVHFGIGKARQAEMLKVRWTDGSETILQNPPINQRIAVKK